MMKRRGASGRRPGFRLGASGARNLVLVSIFLGLALLDLCARSGILVLNRRPSSGGGPDSAEAGLDRDAGISGGGGGGGDDDDDGDERKFDALVNSDLVDQTESESDGWGAYERDEDSDKMALAPLNTLLDDADPLLECCPILREYDAVCTCKPVLEKMEEVTLNLTTQMVKLIMDNELDHQPIQLVSDFYSDWKQNLEANPEATLVQKQIFCTETLVEQAEKAVKKTVDRRKKKLEMGVSEANLPWLLKLENIAKASRVEVHRAKETSQACLAYIDVLEEETELKEQVEARERENRRAKRNAQRQRDRRRNKNKDLTKASSFNCDELRGRSEFKDYYHKICGKDGEKKGKATILGTNIINTN